MFYYFGMGITFIPEHLKHPASVTRWPPNVPGLIPGYFFSQNISGLNFSSEMLEFGYGLHGDNVIYGVK